MVQYAYDAWGNCKATVLDEAHAAIAELNPFLYRSYYYDSETNLYYLNTRYYDPEVGRFISQDDVSYLDPEHVNGLNLFAYCGNNPVMAVDPNGNSWWDWIISGLQIIAGALLMATGLGAGFGAMLVTGGALGMVTNAIGSTIGGGIGSMLNGWGAISTGISLLSFGPLGIIAGIGLIAVGSATVVMGANEVATGITGTNHLRNLMGANLYDGIYIGLNIASSVGTVVGRLGMSIAGTQINNSRPSNSKPYARHISADGRMDAHYNGNGVLSWSRHIHNTKNGPNTLHWHVEKPHSGEIFNYLKFFFVRIFRG